MKYVEAIALLRTQLSLNNYSGKEQDDLTLLFNLSKAQRFLGNTYNLYEKTADVRLVANQYIYPAGAATGDFPQDVRDIKSISYGIHTPATRCSPEECEEDINYNFNVIFTKYSLLNNSLYLNFKPSVGYSSDNTQVLKIKYTHQFLRFTGLANYEFPTITKALDGTFNLPEKYQDMMIDLATAYYVPGLLNTVEAQISEELSRSSDYRTSELPYKLGV